MARRVALARAIALDPELMMYDEPFAGLDPISLGITANLIRTLNDALGATSILVTHDVPESLRDRRLRVLPRATAGSSRRGHAGRAARVGRPDGAPVHRRRARRPGANSTIRRRAAGGGLRHRRRPAHDQRDRSLGSVDARSSCGIGYATRFFVAAAARNFPGVLRRPRLVTTQIHFVGNYSLVIIAVSGLFVGFVLGLQGYYTLNRYGSDRGAGAAGRAVARARTRARSSPRCCSPAAPARR